MNRAVRDITGSGADHVFDFVGARPVAAQGFQSLADTDAGYEALKEPGTARVVITDLS
ncbi:hypothetical protein [Actinoplanes sp. GCM10030250]|uniref:hypothetical protein n=1 Tax=Actinoplanes sp. GCM10030250 TaxID=3273376 RepID=UPI003618562E